MKDNKQYSVLVVDNDRNTLSNIITFLCEAGFEAFMTDHEEYISGAITANNPDLIILCENGDEFDSADACRQIKLNHNWVDIPIIIVLDTIDNEVFAKFTKYGANDFISKPIKKDELLYRVNNQIKLLQFNLLKEEQTNKIKQLNNELSLLRKDYAKLKEEFNDRENSQTELSKYKSLIDQTLNQCPIPLVLVSMPDMILRVVNQATIEFLGFDNEPSIINTNLLDLKPSWQDYDINGIAGKLEELPLVRALNGYYTYNEERKIVRKDGTYRWELVSGVPIFDTKGQIIAGFLIMNDITDKKNAVEKLEESKLRYQTFFEQGHDGIVVIDPETAHFIEFNDQVCSQLGYTKEEFAKLSIFDIEAEETFEQTKQHISQIMANGREEFFTKHRTKTGETKDIMVIANYLQIEDKHLYHCIWRDITEIKLNEAALIKSILR